MRQTTKEHCSKCGQLIIKKKNTTRTFCLSGYEPKENLCINCNAVNSIVARLASKREISDTELKILPSYLVFDPNGTDPVEESYGIQFSTIICNTKQLMEQYSHSG